MDIFILIIDIFRLIFPMKPIFVFFQNHPFQAFLVSKTYIFIHVKHARIKLLGPLTAWGLGGGSRPWRAGRQKLTFSLKLFIDNSVTFFPLPRTLYCQVAAFHHPLQSKTITTFYINCFLALINDTFLA